MKLKIYNDGKGKSQSFEAIIEDSNINELVNGTFINSYDISDLIGYGFDAEEAREDLIIKLNFIINSLEEFRNTVAQESSIILYHEIEGMINA